MMDVTQWQSACLALDLTPALKTKSKTAEANIKLKTKTNT
jgi:hypothetical protein